MSIRKKLIILIELLVIFGAGVSLLAFYFPSKYFIEEVIGRHLESVAVIKEKQILNIIEENKSDVLFWSKDESLINYLAGGTTENNHSFIAKYLNSQLVSEDVITELFIVNLEGKIIISTAEDREGKFVSFEPYFIEGKKGIYTQGFYQDMVISTPGVTISGPINDINGNTIAVLAGRLNLQKFSDILNERTGLGLGGETYLVNKINLLVTDTLFFEGKKFEKYFYSEGMTHCLSGHNGAHNKDYVNQDVFGLHRFLPGIESCLVVDIDSVEAYRQINYLRFITFLIIFLLSLFSVPIIFIISSSISTPIKKLKESVEKIKNGENITNIDIKTGDEIEDLANSFNSMNLSLNDYKNNLEDKIKERTRELDSKMEELEKINKLMIGRELKMIELKKEVAELKERLAKIQI